LPRNLKYQNNMNYIEITKPDGSTKTIFVDHSIKPQEQLTYNELAQYHREMSQKTRSNGRGVN